MTTVLFDIEHNNKMIQQIAAVEVSSGRKFNMYVKSTPTKYNGLTRKVLNSGESEEQVVNSFLYWLWCLKKGGLITYTGWNIATDVKWIIRASIKYNVFTFFQSLFGCQDDLMYSFAVKNERKGKKMKQSDAIVQYIYSDTDSKYVQTHCADDDVADCLMLYKLRDETFSKQLKTFDNIMNEYIKNRKRAYDKKMKALFTELMKKINIEFAKEKALFM